MKLRSRRKLPDEGELVVADVVEVHDHGAYLELMEFPGVNAYLPWSEVATKAIRSIKEVLRPNLRLVVKVIRVYSNKGSVDVSLKRVMEGEKRRKMMYYKRYAKAAALILGVAARMKKGEEEAYKEVIWKLEEAYGDPLTGLERAVIEGARALENAGIPKAWVEPLLEMAKTHVKLKTAKISGVFLLRSRAGEGVYRIKELLKKVEEVAKDENVRVRLYYIGSPRYRIDLEGYDYKVLEERLAKVLKTAEEEAKRLGVEMSFERLKE
ncbi:MAG: translation initiation factor IF-2 subunit alpha [Acidilobaceae archaeon]|nr:translation initiation factor IF-2 subunit alpha [Acidilobaceae archaeon]MDW7973914.1 translation initiation factor IF-2 subunit alpha [Sulfolobales archaeon]